MLKSGSLVLMLLAGVASVAIAEGVDTTPSPAPVPAAAKYKSVLTQQGRIFDENAAAEPTPVDPKGAQLDGSPAQSGQARTTRNPTVTQGLKASREKSPGTTSGQASGKDGVDPFALKGAPVTGNPHEMPDNAAKTSHDISKSSIGNIRAREATVGIAGGSVPPNGTPGSAAEGRALTMGRDQLKGTTKTSKPLAAGQTVPNVDVSVPKIGQPGSR